MHPNKAFQPAEKTLHEELIRRTGFGTIFCETSHGPRVAHAPILLTKSGNVRFHLARGNAITSQLTDRKALIVINGPDAYISARWYKDPNQVPTWNYVTAEIEGNVSELDNAELPTLVKNLSDHHETRVKGGVPWTIDKMSSDHFNRLLRAITGFEMTITATRETVKLSQNKSEVERKRLIAGLEKQGEVAMASMMRAHTK